jgi:hypothetical protein
LDTKSHTTRPNFVWDDEIHGNAQDFWILVEDCDGEEILFHDRFLLGSRDGLDLSLNIESRELGHQVAHNTSSLGHAQKWILVEDCDGEEILFHDRFLLRGEFAKSEMNEHLVGFRHPRQS